MIHNHPCPTCRWQYPCTCNDPSEHSDPCFECAAKAASVPAGGISTPDIAPEPEPPASWATDELWAGWEKP